MSDYPHSNITRSDGISGRGLLITAALFGLLFVVLAAFGSDSGGPSPANTSLEPTTDSAAPIVVDPGTAPVLD